MSKKAWKRKLIVTLSSSICHRKMVFGDDLTNNLNISIRGKKRLSTLQDEFTIEIKNLSYDKILELIKNKYFDVKIEAGYETGGIFTVYEGAVLYITNAKDDYNTNTCTILCANKLIAVYGQERMTMSLNSSINMYAALQYICKKAGINNANISDQLKKEILTDQETGSSGVAGWINQITSNSGNILVNTDSSVSNDISIWRKNYRLRGKINLTNQNIIASSGYPRLTNNGVNIKILPTMPILVGDTVSIDNSILDVSVSSSDEIYKNYTNFIDPKGEYIVYSIGYSLENRSRSFYLTLELKTKSLYGEILGV